MFSQDPLKKLIGQVRKRFGGNFYVAVSDAIVAGKVQCLHQLDKHAVIPTKDEK